MRKFFLIPLVALFTCVNVWADSVIAEMSVNGGDPVSYTTMSDLQTAINGLSADAVVTLKKTIELAGANAYTFHVPSGKNVTLNLNGFNFIQTMEVTCTYSYFGTPVDPSDPAFNELKSYGLLEENCDESSIADIQENALIFNEGTLHIISEGTSIVQFINKTSMNLEHATTICNKGALTIDGGIFLSTKCYLVDHWIKTPVIWNDGDDAVVNINGGVFLSDESDSDYQIGNYWSSIVGGKMHIKGGIFSQDEMVGILDHPNTQEYINTNNLETNYEAILVPYSNARIDGYDRKRTDPSFGHHWVEGMTAENYNTGTYRNRYRYEVKPVCVVMPKDREVVNESKSLDGMVTGLEVQEGKTLTIAEGTTLKVGAGGIAIGGKDNEGNIAKIVVEKGATLISENDIITGRHQNIELTMDEVKRTYSNLLIKAEKIQGSHPNATVKLISKAKGSGAVWQRFAVPTYAEDFMLDSIKYDKDTYPTAFFQWGADAWEVILPSAKATTAADPFRGYAMTTSNANAGAEYTFKCELVGNGNPSLDINAGWNYFANAYTAPMNIKAWLTDLMREASLDEENTINAAVYVQNKSSNRWKSYAYADVDNDRISKTAALEPMQAFVYYATASGTNSLKYTDYVYTPFMHPSLAPRRAAREVDYAEAEIILTDQNGDEDVIALYEGERFSSELDNGYDIPKIMDDDNLFYIYLVSKLGNLERLAADDINNAAISVKTPDAGEFTFSFANVTLENCFLVDVETETKTEIKEGNTYVFTAEANGDYSGRFVIVKDGGEDPSAIDNIETKHIANGIYSITGIYMGTNFETLPAGIYVVNGKKVVK